MRNFGYTFGAILVLLSALIIAFLFHSTVVLRKSLQEFNVSEAVTDGHSVVTINGRLIGGMAAIRSADQNRTGRRIILLVWAGITRPGLRNATFHYEIRVPSDVDEISFGDAKTVVWRRKN
jgi:hypothetical protein